MLNCGQIGDGVSPIPLFDHVVYDGKVWLFIAWHPSDLDKVVLEGEAGERHYPSTSACIAHDPQQGR